MIRTHLTSLCSLVATATFLFIASIPAQAITIPLGGQITHAAPDPNTLFGVSVGNSITGFATLDETLVTADPNAVIYPGLDPTFALELTIGSATFRETDDFGYSSFPELTFINGVLTNINFAVIFDFDGTTVDPFGNTFGLNLLDGMFSIQDQVSGALLVAGSAQPVPEPGTLLLMISGLAGMIGLGRKHLKMQVNG